MKVDTEKHFAGATLIELGYDGANIQSVSDDRITPVRRGVADLLIITNTTTSAYAVAVTILDIIPDAQALRFKILLQRLYELCEFDFASCTDELAKLVEMRFYQRINEFPTELSNNNEFKDVKKMASPLGATIEWFEGANMASEVLELIESIAEGLFPILCTDYVKPELPYFSAHGIRLTETKESLDYVTTEGVTGII